MDEELVLVEQARAGSEEAFTDIVRLHQGRIRAFLGRYLRDRDAVDDLAQETFLTAFRSLATYKGDSPLSIWLIGIARHRALVYLRSEARRRARETGSLQAALSEWRLRRFEDIPFDASLEDRRTAALAECIRQLPEPGASMIHDFYVRGLPAVQIARASGRNEGGVRMALLRLRQALRRCMEEKLALEAGR